MRFREANPDPRATEADRDTVDIPVRPPPEPPAERAAGSHRRRSSTPDIGSTISIPGPTSRRCGETSPQRRPILRSDMQPAIRYARNGDVHLAYEVVGSGPIDILSTPEYPFAPPLGSWHPR